MCSRNSNLAAVYTVKSQTWLLRWPSRVTARPSLIQIKIPGKNSQLQNGARIQSDALDNTLGGGGSNLAEESQAIKKAFGGFLLP
jgi:hypothetical protein